MTYLFGDSTPSTLRSNFLEFLRDVLDFSVYVLEAEARILDGRARVRALTDTASLEIEQLGSFGRAVTTTIETAPKGAANSPAVECAARLHSLTSDTVNAAIEAVRMRLSAEMRQAEAEESVERDACHKALETLLVPHDPPDGFSVLHLLLASDGNRSTGAYSATMDGNWPIGLAWRFELDLRESIFTRPLQVEQLLAGLEISAPELTGWIKKEVKIRPQRLARYWIVQADDDGTTVALRLRSDDELGFDLVINLATAAVSASRLNPKEDAASGPFEVEPEDVPKLVELGKIVHSALARLPRKALIVASVDDAEFRAQERFADLVEKMVAGMAPLCEEISRRSLAPKELVLRRLLADDRREEIFVSKSTLVAKLAPLAPHYRRLFDPLGLEPAAPEPAAEAAPQQALREAARVELPHSQPPPPPPKPEPPPVEAPPIAPSRTTDPGPVGNVAPTPAAPEEPITEISIEQDSDEEPNDEQAPGGASDLGLRNPELATELDRIAAILAAGAVDDAYRRYETLFSGASFNDNLLDDRRHALRQMILAASPPAPSDAVRDAHRAAQERLAVLVNRLQDPGDYELLGVCLQVLDDEAGATSAFRAGLELELERDAQSLLCQSLLRRVTRE